MPQQHHSFKTVRWIRTLNLVAQALLLLTLFFSLNYIARHYSWRFDLSQHRHQSLSPETLSYLKNLPRSVRVIVTLTNDPSNDLIAQAWKDTSNLLREFTYATETNPAHKITADFIDVHQRRRDAEALGIDRPDTILVLSGNNRREVSLDELYLVENDRKKAFLGEQALTAAILDVSSQTKKKIYFLEGHGEMTLDNVTPERGLSSLNQHLLLRNFDTATLNLAETRKIPADTALIVIPGPQGKLSASEEELLRQYLSTRAGRLIALLPPTYPHGLDNLLFDWGALADDDLIYDSGTSSQNDTGDLILYPTAAEHPVTQSLRAYRIPLRFGATRSIRPDLGRPIDNNLAVIPLIVAPKTAWGERDYRATGTPVYNPASDIPPPLSIATASERLPTLDNLPFSVPGGRLVAIGSADWIANENLSTIGNLSLLLAAINWTTGRDTQLNVPARPIQYYNFPLSHSQLNHLRYSLILLIPAILALIGAIVYWTRRN